jgi:D-mannonate dehydratase
MDTSQLLSMTEGSDLSNWMPSFDIFKPDFELDADNAPWETLNYDKLDWDNFNVSAVQWNNAEMMTKSWTNLIGGNIDFSNVGDGVSGNGV